MVSSGAVGPLVTPLDSSSVIVALPSPNFYTLVKGAKVGSHLNFEPLRWSISERTQCIWNL